MGRTERPATPTLDAMNVPASGVRGFALLARRRTCWILWSTLPGAVGGGRVPAIAALGAGPGDSLRLWQAAENG